MNHRRGRAVISANCGRPVGGLGRGDSGPRCAARGTGPGGTGANRDQPDRATRSIIELSENDPWQLYASTRSLEKANTIAAEVKSSGYQSAGREQLDAGAAALSGCGRNQCVAILPDVELVVGLQLLRRSRPDTTTTAGTAAGIRRTAIDLIPTTGGTANRSWYGVGLWRALLGWRLAARRRLGWRGLERRRVERQSSQLEQQPRRSQHARCAAHERHSEHAHHQNHAHRNTAGHHQPGHHAAARHANHASAEHRGTGHRARGARTAGHRAAGHRAGGHAAPRARGAEAAAATTIRPGATRPAITRPITIPESDAKLDIRPVLLQQARRWITSGYRLGSRESHLVALLVLAPATNRQAQDPQSQTLEQLLGQLKDPDAAKRRQAVVSLGLVRPGPDQGDDHAGRRAARRIPIWAFVTRLRFRSAISARRRRWPLPNIRAAVKDQSPLVRRAAVFALGNLGTAARSAVPELVAALG